MSSITSEQFGFRIADFTADSLTLEAQLLDLHTSEVMPDSKNFALRILTDLWGRVDKQSTNKAMKRLVSMSDEREVKISKEELEELHPDDETYKQNVIKHLEAKYGVVILDEYVYSFKSDDKLFEDFQVWDEGLFDEELRQRVAQIREDRKNGIPEKYVSYTDCVAANESGVVNLSKTLLTPLLLTQEDTDLFYDQSKMTNRAQERIGKKYGGVIRGIDLLERRIHLTPDLTLFKEETETIIKSIEVKKTDKKNSVISIRVSDPVYLDFIKEKCYWECSPSWWA